MRILLTGEDGKFSNIFKRYCKEHYPDYVINTVSMFGDSWKNYNFDGYDAVIHCAGIIHSDIDSYDEYKEVNVDKTRELCDVLKKTDSKCLVFLSSMAVYDGMDWNLDPASKINRKTVPIQSSYYGRSKFEAEKAVEEVLGDSNTRWMIVRAPSIVGKGMEDYFSRYVKMASIPFIPIPMAYVENKRSIVYADTLVAFILEIIKNGLSGSYFPQNLPALSVSQIYETICDEKKFKRIKSGFLYRMIPFKIKKKFFRQISYDENLDYEINRKVGSISSFDAVRLSVRDDVR